MTCPSKPDAGCLSVLSSCLKIRNKTGAQACESKKEAAASASSALRVGESATQRPASDEIPTSTPLHDEAHDPPPAESHALSAAIIEDQPTSLVPASDQESVTRDCPATTLDLWQEACDEVDEKTRTWIKNASLANAKASADELVKLVRSKEAEHKEQAPKLPVGDREILWRDYANRVVSVVTSIGDIAISFAPAPSSIVWSAVKVLLKANVTQCNELVAIMGCTDMVLRVVRRGRVYEEVYIGESPRATAQEDLKQKLVSVYKTCLEFLVFVYEAWQQGKLTGFLYALLDPGIGEKRVSEVKALEQELASAAHACEAKAGEEHRKLLRSLEGPLKRVDDNVTALFARLEIKDRQEAMEYISTVPVGSDHNEKREARTENTCEWLITHPKFLEWEDSACSSLLWLQGSIGTGKSFLSSKVIDRYCNRNTVQLPSKHDEGFAYFYCSSSETRRSIQSILRSYIRQLSEVPGRPESVHVSSYNLYRNKDKVQHYISVDDCETTLTEIVNSYPRTTLVLDALDECGKDVRGQLAKLFKRLVQKSNRLLKIFIASRKESDIEEYLASLGRPQMLIPISTSDNKGDIEKFVVVEMDKVSANWMKATSETKDHVKEELLKRSDGMFRWAYLHWAQLKECVTTADVQRSLETFPKTLSGAYDELYNHYDSESSARMMLQRAVRWVMCACEPLNSCALLTAMRLESESVDGALAFRKSDLTEQTLETVCRHLIVRDPNLGIWKFPHASVAEYFGAKDEPWVKDAQVEVTVFLIRLLTDCCSNPPPAWKNLETIMDVEKWFETGQADPDHALDPRHPLQTYIHQNWLHHIHHLSDRDLKPTPVSEALKQFLGDSTQQPSEMYWVFRKYIMSAHWSYYARMSHYSSGKANSAFAVVAMGLDRMLDGWWDEGLDLSLLSELLPIAIRFGSIELCKNLIRRGCDVNGQAKTTDASALGTSIAVRNFDMTKLLLERGADPDRVIGHESLLCLAVGTGTEYAELLLAQDADPNIECDTVSYWGCEFACAASRAAHDGNIDALKVLARKGADLKKENLIDENGSPLAAAVREGQLDCARFLIEEQGANANALLKTGKFGSALAAAASYGRLECCRLLIKHHADINVRLESGEYGSVLAAAILGGRTSLDMIKCLVGEMKADLNQLTFVPPERKEEGRMESWKIAESRRWMESWKRLESERMTESRRWMDSRRWMGSRRMMESERRQTFWTPREEIAAYLLHERQMDVQVLISLGIP